VRGLIPGVITIRNDAEDQHECGTGHDNRSGHRRPANPVTGVSWKTVAQDSKTQSDDRRGADREQSDVSTRQ
jgi:hypothetical protein